MFARERLKKAYIHACEMELQAFKPGNVSVYAEGHDMTVEDFRISAQVSAEPLTNPQYSLGEKIYYAVKATRNAVHCNTNLGILLLCAPLLQAMENYRADRTLRQNLADILRQTCIDDADWVFKAITLAAPGGLGANDEQDVKEKAEINLTRAMQLAAEQDRIAYQYVSDYKDVFETMFLSYNLGFKRWGDQKWAATAAYVDFLCQYPDSHIVRKYGSLFTEFVVTHMKTVEAGLAQSDNPEQMLALLHHTDAEFKSKGVNPGTTADLTVTLLLIVELERMLAVQA